MTDPLSPAQLRFREALTSRDGGLILKIGEEALDEAFAMLEKCPPTLQSYVSVASPDNLLAVGWVCLDDWYLGHETSCVRELAHVFLGQLLTQTVLNLTREDCIVEPYNLYVHTVTMRTMVKGWVVKLSSAGHKKLAAEVGK